MSNLKNYWDKRNFDKTDEPEGKEEKSGTRLHFVVQRHAASRLHYDFRLEMEGVLKSWAVPKGPSLNPKDKRLAMMVEDHPFDYRHFEGSIPKGNYGAGEVEIWDEGYYEPLEKIKGKKDEGILLRALHSGSLKIKMKGKKLKGEFALVKIKNGKEDNAWLLIKHRDAYATDEAYDAEMHTKKNSKVTKVLEKKSARKRASSITPKSSIAIKKARHFDKNLINTSKISGALKPMLAKVSERPFDNPDWLFEIKWDGYRAIAEVKSDLKLYSRNGLSFIEKYPDVLSALEVQEQQMILDGELVAYDDAGKPSFQALQQVADKPETPVIFHVFDLLELNNIDTTSLPLKERKTLLREALRDHPHMKFSDHVEKTGIDFFAAAEQQNLEGIMAKRCNSLYETGRRSDSWLKIKTQQTDEAIICGFTEPKGSRKGFGSLILGKQIDGILTYVGHAGTGFTAKSLLEVYEQLKKIVVKTCPFATVPKTNGPATWVKPILVCQIKYAERTENGTFRHPVFMGLRVDKTAAEVKEDEIVAAPVTLNARLKKAKTSNLEASGRPSSASTKTAPKATMPQKKQKAKSVKREEKKVGTILVPLSNLDKIYWPKEGITKGDLIEYYDQIASYILPYLKGRPQSLNRFPNGIEEQSFYHKDAGEQAPDWVSTTQVFSESTQKMIDYIICDNKATLLYLANLGCIEMNPWNSKVGSLDHPDYLIIDLDPSEKNTFLQVVETARECKHLLDEWGVAAFCKTSGASGLHIYIPMGAKYRYDQVRSFAQVLMLQLNEALPEFTTLERSLSKRPKSKIYLDYLQNRSGQTVASVYSVRPKPGAPVSTPLEWSEVVAGLDPRDFTIVSIQERLKSVGDLFKPVLGRGINLEKVLKNIKP